MSPVFAHNGISFSYIDEGDGSAFVFQHGLGGDASQPRQLWSGRGRLICMECRGHGETDPVGPEAELSFATYASDVAALADFLGVKTMALGGVSMGAGVALALASQQPQRVRSLVLVRPAWFTSGAPPNLRAYPEIGRLLREHGPEAGLDLFKQTGTYRGMLAASPGAAESLLGQFHRPHAQERAAVLNRMPDDRPLPDLGPWPQLDMPTLILATPEDPIHPLSCAAAWAQALPNVTLQQVTSRYVDGPRHAREVSAAIDQFLA